MAEVDVRESLSFADLRDAWPILADEDRAEGFRMLPRAQSDDFFLDLSARDQGALLLALPPEERRLWIRLLAPDDAADVVQQVAREERDGLVALLDPQTRKEVNALLAYAEDAAGGLMSPRYARVRPDMTADEAISYLRRQAKDQHLETIYTAYVLDEQGRLVGVVSFRDLFLAQPTARVRELMEREVVKARDDMDQEAVSRLFAEHDLAAIPVVDAEDRMKGIVTVDDIVDVVQEEATEDIQKIGGMSALEAPYFQVSFLDMLKKRGGWLALLFLGEMLTTTAMARFEHDIARAVVLALFVPLIISSGGNSGSQATTLVIRAMALGEVRLRDWWRVARREVGTGLALGLALGAIGFLRIVLWEAVKPTYGEHYVAIAATVFTALVAVVALGAVVGSLLPFLMRRLGFDPASASAPFVATLVDVTGLLIYFSVASVLLRGTLL
jgi:magnesium transporter